MKRVTRTTVETKTSQGSLAFEQAMPLAFAFEQAIKANFVEPSKLV